MPAVMKIFAGPPGTGKTWSAAREAVRVLLPDVEEKNIAAEHRKLVNEGKIIWVTFHPSYSYDDFVEGFRPATNDEGQIVYQIVPGPFRRACQTAGAAVTANRFEVGQEIGQYTVVHVEAGGVVLESEVTRQDAVTPTIRQFVDFWTLRVLQDHGLGPDALRLGGQKADERRDVARLTGLPTTFLTNSSPHAAVFEYLLKNSVSVTETPVVLVIDEINRADLSRVFGELITLLEFDKRKGQPDERQVWLTYSQFPLSVPSSLSIIGTMNTADKSLSTVDLALRRRFEFSLLSPDPEKTPAAYGGVNVRAFFDTLNRRLAHLAGSDNLIGHADFMASKLGELRKRHGFADDKEGRRKALAHVLRSKTVPLLLDLFRGDWRRVRAVVGPTLFEAEPAPPGFEEDDADLVAGGEPSWRLASWWDPAGAWDDAKFLTALSDYKPSKDTES